MLLEQQGNHDVTVALLGELVLDSASTFATEHLAKAMLAKIAGA
jgi:hypothetical protein